MLAGVSVGVDAGVLVGVSVGVDAGVLVGVSVGVDAGVLVGVSVGVDAGVLVGVGVGVVRLQADTSVMVRIMMMSRATQSTVFLFIGNLLFKLH